MRPPHRRALIVEDEPLFAMGLADMQALGFDCDLAANGQDAFLQAMAGCAPDIVLMALISKEVATASRPLGGF